MTPRLIGRTGLTLCLLTAMLAGCTSSREDRAAQLFNNPDQKPDPTVPPELKRELRGVWVATVSNIDWPSEPGLPTDRQQAEVRAILDHADEMNLNVIVLQVRPAADALYASDIEPWSYYLTGEQGKAPDPFYDPLEYWIQEAHDRGIELHVWLNPFRVRPSGEPFEPSEDSIARTRPDLVVDYGTERSSQLWMNPGEPEARQQTLDVFRDLVTRYDLDGVHMDDYFYPYPVRENADAAATEVPFPDDEAYAKYKRQGGELALKDFRRDAINNLVEEIYEQTKAIKPHVRVGISPFGIARPGNPPSVQGFDQYDKLYADARLWLNEGWVDYYTPQLYWRISAPQQSYPALLMWWQGQNLHDRTLAPGLYAGRVGGENGWPVEELVGQIYITRAFSDFVGEPMGNVLFSMRSLTQNPANLSEELRDKVYPTPALVPSMPWIDGSAPPRPQVALSEAPADAVPVPTTQPIEGLGNKYRGMEMTTRPAADGGLRVSFSARGSEAPRWWAVQSLRGTTWELEIIPGTREEIVLPQYAGRPIARVAVRAIDAAGNESEPTIVDHVPLTEAAP